MIYVINIFSDVEDVYNFIWSSSGLNSEFGLNYIVLVIPLVAYY